MTISELKEKHNPFEYPFQLPIQTEPCCYFLCSESEVKYVGQTVRLPARLGEHVVSKPVFTEVFFVPIPLRKLTKTESEYIAEIDPPWNGGIGGGTILNLKAIRERLGIKRTAELLHIPPHAKRDADAKRIFELESSLSTIQQLLTVAMKKDSFEIVANVHSLIGEVLSNIRFKQRGF